MKALRGNWNYPTLIRFGAGRISELPDACKSLNMTRALLVTDPGLAKLPVIEKDVAACVAAGLPCTVYSDVQADPIEANVNNGVRVFREGRQDGVIAVVGGRALDTGMATALMV